MNSGTRNHSKAKSSVSTTKTVRKPNVVTPKKPMWKPTGRHFTLYASSPLTRILEPIDEPVELTPSVSSNANLTIESYPSSLAVVQIVLWYLDSGCSKHMTGDRKRLINFVEKFIGTMRFGVRFETLLPLLGVRQMSPETLKELQE
uniref:Integrase, catalytic region, zinc finger, CCHC-type, peptidase aspartic, catalytic n=1 Tax=Tanacetum cinerariifolium TaxID=118510 RepID=A0A699QJN2_TANCI|nr:integrase, catalytic region, zinc finger, CCHC-type, peptidase aspartic, catalytic [Tanacetum cinerariifolium]